MDPSYNNSFGQFGSGVGSGVGQPGITIVSSPASAKRSNRKIIAVIVGVVVAAVAVALVVWVITRGNGPSVPREELHGTVWNVGEQYGEAIYIYDARIGLTPVFSDNGTLYPFSPFIESLTERMKSAEVPAEELYAIPSDASSMSIGERRKLVVAKGKVDQTLTTILSNLETLQAFQDAFFSPLQMSLDSLQCQQTDKISLLLGSQNASVSLAAETYFDLYCGIIEHEPEDGLEELATQGRLQLAACLVPIGEDSTGLDELEELTEELKK